MSHPPRPKRAARVRTLVPPEATIFLRIVASSPMACQADALYVNIFSKLFREWRVRRPSV